MVKGLLKGFLEHVSNCLNMSGCIVIRVSLWSQTDSPIEACVFWLCGRDCFMCGLLCCEGEDDAAISAVSLWSFSFEVPALNLVFGPLRTIVLVVGCGGVSSVSFWVVCNAAGTCSPSVRYPEERSSKGTLPPPQAAAHAPLTFTFQTVITTCIQYSLALLYFYHCMLSNTILHHIFVYFFAYIFHIFIFDFPALLTFGTHLSIPFFFFILYEVFNYTHPLIRLLNRFHFIIKHSWSVHSFPIHLIF